MGEEREETSGRADPPQEEEADSPDSETRTTLLEDVDVDSPSFRLDTSPPLDVGLLSELKDRNTTSVRGLEHSLGADKIDAISSIDTLSTSSAFGTDSSVPSLKDAALSPTDSGIGMSGWSDKMNTTLGEGWPDHTSSIHGLGDSSTFDSFGMGVDIDESTPSTLTDLLDSSSTWGTDDAIPGLRGTALSPTDSGIGMSSWSDKMNTTLGEGWPDHTSSIHGLGDSSTIGSVDMFWDSEGLRTTTLLDSVDTSSSLDSSAIRRQVSQHPIPQTGETPTSLNERPEGIASEIDSFIQYTHAQYSFQRTYSALVAYGGTIDDRVLYFIAAQLLNTGSAAIAGPQGLAVSFIGSALAIYAFVGSGNEEDE